MIEVAAATDPVSLSARILAARGGRHLLVLLDFDGTLCEFAADPQAVVLAAGTATALAALEACAGVTIGVVSGRRAADVRRRLPRTIGAFVAGCHGLEIEGRGAAFRHPAVDAGAVVARQLADAFRPRLASWPGTFVEDKGLSVALHVREASPDHAAAAAAAFMETASDAVCAGTLRVLEGACVTELLPAVDWHKGRAVEWIRQRVEAATGETFTIFAGDDLTDEDAFRAVHAPGLAIAASERPCGADVRLDGPAAVGSLLASLAGSCGALAP